ncbi:MAG: polyprenyl diphosphate synthase, partial [Candidatus Omnitrophota bacterium]
MINKDNIPKHIAIIMDGNGRWAKENHLPRTAGHRAGINRVKEIVKASGELGIGILTLFAFSSENWTRPRKEIDMLMRSLNNFLSHEINDLVKNNIKLITIGRKEPIPKFLQ